MTPEPQKAVAPPTGLRGEQQGSRYSREGGVRAKGLIGKEKRRGNGRKGMGMLRRQNFFDKALQGIFHKLNRSCR